MNYYCGCHLCDMWIQQHCPWANPAFQTQAYLPPYNELQFKIESQDDISKHIIEPVLPSYLMNSLIPEPVDAEEDNYEVSEREEEKIKKMDQKEGRNILSNIFRSFHKFLQKDIGVKRFQEMKLEFNWRCSVDDLLKLFKESNINSRSYIKLKTIKQIVVKEEVLYGGVFKRLLRDYLVKFSRNHFLTSKKIKKESRPDVLHYIRNLQEAIDHDWIRKNIQRNK